MNGWSQSLLELYDQCTVGAEVVLVVFYFSFSPLVNVFCMSLLGPHALGRWFDVPGEELLDERYRGLKRLVI